MSKTKQPSDRRGSRIKRNPRDPGPERKKSSKQELDSDSANDDTAIAGESDGAVDEMMELDTSKYERPIAKG